MNNPPEVFELKKDTHKANCIARIAELEANEDKPYQVEIYTAKDLRTKKQNALYWKHMGEYSEATGDEVADLHFKLKKKYLHVIFMSATNKEAINYQVNYQALMTVYNAGIGVDVSLLLAEILTTTRATTSQMMKYINSYWPDINARGIYLTDPGVLTGD